MGASHAHPLYLPGTSPLHRARPQCKIAASLLFVLAVVATPRESFWAFGLYALALAAVAAVGRIPLAFLARRLVIELPFLLFAVFLPFVGQGERVEVLGVPLAVGGLWGAWNIVAKGTLGVAASAIVAATTPVAELLRGLERLRLPTLLVTIAGFMVRYADVIADEVRRMRIARISRGHDPRWIWQARAVAASAGTLFIRSYERASGSTWRWYRAATPGRCRCSRIWPRPAPSGWPPWPCRPRPPWWRPPPRGSGCDHGARASGGRDPAGPGGRRGRLRLPGRAPGAVRGELLGPARGAGCPARAQRGRQDHPGAAAQRGAAGGRGPGRGGRHAGRPRAPAGDPAPGRDRLPGTRRPAVHAHGGRGRGLRPGQPRPARGRAGDPGQGRPGRGGHGGARRPPAPPPVVRAPAPGRGGHRPGHGARGPGPGRALVEPGPGQPPGAGRDRREPGHHHPDGHPRPALRPPALPAVPDPERRPDHRRRPHRRAAGRHRAAGRQPPGAAVRVRPGRPRSPLNRRAAVRVCFGDEVAWSGPAAPAGRRGGRRGGGRARPCLRPGRPPARAPPGPAGRQRPPVLVGGDRRRHRARPWVARDHPGQELPGRGAARGPPGRRAPWPPGRPPGPAPGHHLPGPGADRTARRRGPALGAGGRPPAARRRRRPAAGRHRTGPRPGLGRPGRRGRRPRPAPPGRPP